MEECRTIEELINNHIPYSDMNEMEIDMVVEYKSNVKARNEQFKMQMEQAAALAAERSATYARVAEEASKRLDDMIAAVMEEAHV